MSSSFSLVMSMILQDGFLLVHKHPSLVLAGLTGVQLNQEFLIILVAGTITLCKYLGLAVSLDFDRAGG
jgi:hypothetical protein